jgi:hypothetical protein
MGSAATPSNPYKIIEAALLVRDVQFVYAALSTLTRGEPGLYSACLVYLQYMSVTAYESREYLIKAKYMAKDDFEFRFNDLLERSRHSLKLFDDTGRDIDTTLQAVDAAANAARQLFIEMTRFPGLIRSSKLLSSLVDDTFIWEYDGLLVATSNSLQFHTGLAVGVDPAAVRERFAEFGSYINSMLTGDTGQRDDSESYANFWAPSRLTSFDAKFEEFYRGTFAGFSRRESLLLSIFLCRLNALYVLGRLSEDRFPSRLAACKIKFVSTYHVLSSLTKLAIHQTPFEFPAGKRQQIVELLRDPLVSYIYDNKRRHLRNIMVHYGIKKDFKESDIEWDDPFFWHRTKVL